ncbi:hypothetical protein WICPIJ_007762 [Wickerhamomyces pijperi]|uniref:Inositol polyphosphate-related phosphatase domain-containing protein n=1 Tax=Wickerhamomyces pijperi TaxID=599730 RepID=A0A9P8TK47_WICPI|nr:hypothetical protein WICPIJ_007762 [Wickerhamomyces pijperi]
MSHTNTSLFIYTFNCAKQSQLPFAANDTFLLHLSNITDSNASISSILPKDKPDLLVFNFQELLGNLESFYPDKIHDYLMQLTSHIKRAIIEHYQQTSNNDHPVEVSLIGLNYLYALGTLLFSTKPRSSFSNFQKKSVSFGMLNSSLKGCLLSKLDYENERFIFLNCHLAANEGMWKERRKNLDILYRTFPELQPHHSQDIQQPMLSTSEAQPNQHVFLLGDLNLRCDNYIINKTLENFKYDELALHHTSHPLIAQLTESKVTFQQSYKYQVGTESVLNEKRNPSWCDRILYLKDYESVKVHKYGSVMSCTSSDHKPVFLQITVPERKTSSESITASAMAQELQARHNPYSDLELQLNTGLTTMADFSIWLVLFVTFSNTGRLFVIGLSLFYLFWNLPPQSNSSHLSNQIAPKPHKHNPKPTTQEVLSQSPEHIQPNAINWFL